MTTDVTLVRPYQDPIDTFRATSIAEMFMVVPRPRKYWNVLNTAGASFIYDMGIDPEVRSLIFTFQNRTVSHTLRVELDLPPYLRSNLGNVFDVPAIGEGEVGKGIINAVFNFSEAQAATVVPGVDEDFIIFNVQPLGVNGPVFVSTLTIPPVDLNEVTEDTDDVVVDDDVVTDTEETPTDIPEEPIFIEKEVVVNVEVNKWISGLDGQSHDWPPPTGWEVGNDGRMYPPIIIPDPCEVTTGTERDIENISAGDRTPLEQLIYEARDVPPSFGSDTKRRGYIVDVDPFLTGVNTSRVSGRTIELIVADAKDNDVGFKIINWKKYFRNGQLVPDAVSNDEMKQFFLDSNIGVSYLKQGEIASGSWFSRYRIMTNSIKRLLEDGRKIEVENDDDDGALRTKRNWVTIMALVREIEMNGEGNTP